MRMSQVRGLPVVDPVAAHKLGVATDYYVDPVGGRLAGVRLEGDESVGQVVVSAAQIGRIGSHAIMLDGTFRSDGLAAEDEASAWIDGATLSGLEVLGADGNAIGHLQDASFDQDSLHVRAYLLNVPFWLRWFGRQDRITPSSVSACSREVMIVRGREPAVHRETAQEPAEQSSVATEDSRNVSLFEVPPRTDRADGSDSEATDQVIVRPRRKVG